MAIVVAEATEAKAAVAAEAAVASHSGSIHQPCQVLS